MDEVLEQWKAAIVDSDTERVGALFAEHPRLADHVNDSLFPFDRPAAHCCRENLDLIDLLVQHGADLNRKSTWWAGGFGILEGLSPESAGPLIERGVVVDIWAAVGLDDRDRVCELLAADPDLIRAKGGDGKHPIHDATNPQMVDLLVEAGADVNARCVDHESTPLQYLIGRPEVVRRLLHHGAQADVFAAAALGDEALLQTCLADDPDCCDARLGVGDWATAPAGNMYNWTLGHDLTPQQVARNRGHDRVLNRLLQSASPGRRLMDAIDQADRSRVKAIVDENPGVVAGLTEDDRKALARAAWWYRPDSVRLMLELGFDPQVAGVHASTPLDRASFHGYADVVQLLLEADPDPPLDVKNEFGGTPLDACLFGYSHGWKTGHPQDHAATVRLLVDAGSSVEESFLSQGDEAIQAILRRAIDDRG